MNASFSPTYAPFLPVSSRPDAATEQRRQRLQAEMETLYANYAAALPHKIARIEAIWCGLGCDAHRENDATKTCVSSDCDEEVSLPTFYRLVHNLAGSGALYGFVELGRAARELTDFLKPWSDPDAPVSAQPPLQAELCERIETLLAAMKAAI